MSFENVKQFFAQAGADDKILTFEQSSATVEEAAEDVGCEPKQIAKTMAFYVDGHPIVIVMAGDARTDNRRFKDTFHQKAKMIPTEQVEEAVGHAPGGVCPFAVRPGVAVYLDESLKRFDFVYPAAGSDHSAVKLTIPELEKFSSCREWVDVTRDWQEETRRRNGIVVFGAAFMDIKGYPLSQMIPDGRNAGRVLQTHGGVSRNIVEDIGNVELRPTYVSVVDNTSAGTDIIEKLKRHQINTDYILRRENGLGIWLAIFNKDGDVAASISSRPDLSDLSQVLKDRGDEIIGGADSVVVEIDMDPPLLKKIFELADRYGKKVYAAVSNMSIALERRDFMKRTDCVVCNREEAGLLFSEDYSATVPEDLMRIISHKIEMAQFPKMVVTLGAQGAVYADKDGGCGICPAPSVRVADTTGAGDAFFAGVAIGLTYGKTLRESCVIGTRLASSAIATKENVCPRFLPSEFGLQPGGFPPENA